jgi:hypothetical protein
VRSLTRITPRHLAIGAVVLYVVLQPLAVVLPCRTYGWIAVATLVPGALLAIAVVGTEQTRPDIGDTARAATLFIGLCAILGGTLAGLGALC